MTDQDPFLLGFPEKWADKEGVITPETRDYLEYLERHLFGGWTRLGGGTDSIEIIKGELNVVNQEGRDANVAALSIRNDLDDQDFRDHDELVWAKRIVRSIAIAGPRDMYQMGLSAIVFLERYPGINSEFVGINLDGSKITVNGNGNFIKIGKKLETTIKWSTESKSVHFHWFEDGPYWVAI